MSEFKVDEWKAEFELTADTLQALDAKGFNSQKSFKKLTAEIIKKEFKNLSPAQILLLQDAVDSLQDTQAPGPAAQDTGDSDSRDMLSARGTNNSAAAAASQSQPGECDVQHTPSAGLPTGLPQWQAMLDKGVSLSAQDILGMVSGDNVQQPPGNNTEPSSMHGKTLFFDPFTTSTSLPPLKFRDIRDHISSRTKDKSGSRDPSGTLTVNGLDVVLKESKGQLESVRVTQYMEASLRILQLMVAEDKASLSQVMDYAGYIMKIASFAQSFKWESVLRYDYEYRKAQAKLGFHWGADSAYLMQLYLIPSTPMPTSTADNAGKPRPGTNLPRTRNKYDPNSGVIICQRYNGRQGCQLRGCKYAHVCASCYKPHAEVSHKSPQPSAQSE